MPISSDSLNTDPADSLLWEAVKVSASPSEEEPGWLVSSLVV